MPATAKPETFENHRRIVALPPSLRSFVDGYIECLLWAETAYGCPESQDERFDRSFTDMGYEDVHFAPEALDRIIADCEAFYGRHADALNADDVPSLACAGHDFWLTRNGHGAGFWDGDWPESLATALTDASKRAGELSPYVGDDGRIYL